MSLHNAGVSAAILAGGFSVRMGRDKASLPFGDVSLLEHQTQRLRMLGIEDIMISGSGRELAATRSVPDIYPHRGPLSGIHACLEAASHDSVLFLSVDTPLIPIETLQTLLDAHCGGVTLLRHGEQVEPLIGVYDSALAPLCAEILQTEETKVWSLINQIALTTVAYMGDSIFLANCNSPEEYHRILAYARRYHEDEDNERICSPIWRSE